MKVDAENGKLQKRLKSTYVTLLEIYYITFTFSHLADAFIQSDLQMRTMEGIKINKRAMIFKCYNKSQLALRSTRSKVFFFLMI